MNQSFVFSHTPTNVDLSKLPKIERASIKLDRLIGKGAFGKYNSLHLILLYDLCAILGEVYAGKMVNDQSIAIKVIFKNIL